MDLVSCSLCDTAIKKEPEDNQKRPGVHHLEHTRHISSNPTAERMFTTRTMHAMNLLDGPNLRRVHCCGHTANLRKEYSTQKHDDVPWQQRLLPPGWP